MVKMISKKESAILAKEIGSVSVWLECITDAIFKEKHEKVAQYMTWHNDSGKIINALLKTEAVVLYRDHTTGEAY